jgi:hypothetical protein
MCPFLESTMQVPKAKLKGQTKEALSKRSIKESRRFEKTMESYVHPKRR